MNAYRSFRPRRRALWALAAALPALFVLDLALGSVAIPPGAALGALFDAEGVPPVWQKIVVELRLPRALTALLAGAALATAGLQMQTLFRNPLAGPGLLGVTAGAGLGVAFVLLAGGAGALSAAGLRGGAAVTAAAVGGAAAVMGVILLIAARTRDNVVLLIAGVMVGHMAFALAGVWQYFSRPELIRDYLVWTFGSLGNVTLRQLPWLAGPALLGLGATWLLARPMNLLLLGEDDARSLGLRAGRMRLGLVALTSLTTGAVTAYCGPVGFVGIAAPHLARGLLGASDHRLVAPASAMLGAALLLACDLAARWPGSPLLLPINAVTALAGAPVVLWVVLRQRNMQSGFR